MVEGKSSSVWSADEDAELARLQEIHGNRWALVAAELPGKTGQQCAQRWRHKVNPAIKKEKWTPEEDAKLARLYEEHGQRWAEIARHLDGRTDQQCMGRWRRHLDPSVKKDAWAVAEDNQLMTLHDTLGPRWSNISKMLTGRTAQQCRARWFQLSATEDEESLSAGSAPTKRSASAKNLQALVRQRSGSGTPPLSPSTPAVTDETQHGGAVAGSGRGAAAADSKKRGAAGALFAVSGRRRKTLKAAISQGSTGGSEAGGSLASGGSSANPDGFGNGGGLDLLAMLYSAAVTYEHGIAAAQGVFGGAKMPAELHA